MILTLCGLPGSGKTTMAKILSERLHLKWYSMGDMRGKMAQDLGITIDALNERALTDPTSDKTVDEFQSKLAQTEDDFIVDSWMGWHFIPQAVKIFLTVDPHAAAERIFKEQRHDVQSDEPAYISVEEVKQTLAARVENSRQRYLKLYGVDYLKPTNYDAVIDTTHLEPEEVFEQIQAVIVSGSRGVRSWGVASSL